AGQIDQGDHHQQGREDRQHTVVGERRRPVAQVVGLELSDGAFAARPPGGAGELGRPLGRLATTTANVWPLRIAGPTLGHAPAPSCQAWSRLAPCWAPGQTTGQLPSRLRSSSLPCSAPLRLSAWALRNKVASSVSPSRSASWM